MRSISTDKDKSTIYVTLANHWSYVGIGWQLGLESCALSVIDSLAMADYEPSVKTCLNLDARAYELLAEHYPEIMDKFRRYLLAGKLEIIGGTYGQPMGSMVSGESCLRQMVIGQQAVRRVLGIYVDTFLEEEEFSHPQIPQLVKLAGYRFASQAQCDTWGKHGNPPRTDSVFQWQGADGTIVPANPVNALVFHPPCVTKDIDWLCTASGRETVAGFQKNSAPPLVLKWTEFGWGPRELEGLTPNKFYPERFAELAAEYPTEFVTMGQFLERFGACGEIVRLRMDDYQKLLPWGIGGDQLRRFIREVEAILLAAERLDAVAYAVGNAEAQAPAELEEAWKDLLIGQSHDVSLCEYTRWGGGLNPPVNPVLDAHFITWGALGYRHLDAAKVRAKNVLAKAMAGLTALLSGGAAIASAVNGSSLALTAFNPGPGIRKRVLETGKLQLGALAAQELCLLDDHKQPLPCQFLDVVRNEQNHILAANLLFQADSLPEMGYASWQLVADNTMMPSSATTDLHIEETGLMLENSCLRLRLDPCSGGIASLVDKLSGVDCIHANQPFPTLRREGDQVKADISWIEHGPVRATVLSVAKFPGIDMEVRTSLAAGAAYADVHVRLFVHTPPPPPQPPAGGFKNGWILPLEIEDGYWFAFAPGFVPSEIRRDYPFGVESCTKDVVDSLTFLDLMRPDNSGLLLLHGGTQYFKRQQDGSLANLVVREWESHFTGERGCPRVVDYRYRLMPHTAALTDRERLNAAAAFDLPVPCAVHASSNAAQSTGGFFAVHGAAVMSSLRRTVENQLEVRVLRTDDGPGKVQLTGPLCSGAAVQADALGRITGTALRSADGSIELQLRPWELNNLRVQWSKMPDEECK